MGKRVPDVDLSVAWRLPTEADSMSLGVRPRQGSAAAGFMNPANMLILRFSEPSNCDFLCFPRGYRANELGRYRDH